MGLRSRSWWKARRECGGCHATSGRISLTRQADTPADDRGALAVLPGSDVVVHVEPRRHGLDLRDRILAIALAESLVKEAHDITIYEENGSASVSLHLKFPTDLDLRAVLAVAARVEQAIRARPDVSDVQTHLEPLERPLIASPGNPSTDLDVTRTINRIVLELTGAPSQRVRLLLTQAGRVIFVTINVGAQTSLVDAHQLGSTLEENLRQQLPDIADAIVGTETRAQ